MCLLCFINQGEPVLVDISDDCVYLFEWHTNVVCPEKPEVPPSFTSCNYSDSSRGIHFDLLPLKKTGTKPYYEVTVSLFPFTCGGKKIEQFKTSNNSDFPNQQNISYFHTTFSHF